MNVSASKIWNYSNHKKIVCLQNKISYIFVSENVWLNQINNEWEWLSMKVSASKISNDSNRKKLYSVETKICIHLSVQDYAQLNWQKYE